MNIVNRLTIRQLMLNKKRTIVTIIGSVISVAMITAVCTLGFSFLDLMQKITIAETGEWHVLYKNVNREQLEAIKNDEATNTVLLSRDVGFTYLEGGQNPYKPYIYIKEYSRQAFDKFPVKLIEGRLPEKQDELVISQAIVTNGKVGYKIGDSVTLSIGRRYSVQDGEIYFIPPTDSLHSDENGINESLSDDTRKTYTIVGIIERPEWEPAWSPAYTALSFLDENSISSQTKANASVILKKINRGLFSHAKTLAAQNGIGEVDFNYSLLRYYGVIADDRVRNMLFMLTAIIMAIIITGSVALIYNAFAISVSERARYLGMLSSVGATRKQKRNSVFFEGAVIGAISIPLGFIAGIAGIGITFSFINPMIKNILMIPYGMRVIILPVTIALAVFISAGTIFISTWVPAKKASNITAIDAIRQTSDIKLTAREVKTSKLTRVIFGIEGDLALKNLKRNKRRYKATLFSMVISIILFLVVSQFTFVLKKSVSLTQTGVNFDIVINFNTENDNNQEIVIENIKSTGYVKSLTKIDVLDAVSYTNIESLPEYLMENYKDAAENNEISYRIIVNALDDESLMAYAKETGADFARLKDEENPAAIVIDTVKYKDPAEEKYTETRILKLDIGDKIPLYAFDPEAEKDVLLQPLEVISLTGKTPMGVIPRGDYPNLQVVVSKDVLMKITEHMRNSENNIYSMLFVKSDNPVALEEKIQGMLKSLPDNTFSFVNVYAQRKKEEQMIVLISVFTYGFIALITAICIANILNTTSNGIALRRREFAMLKSVGMTPGGFNKMINYESLFYGIKAITFGLPISFAVMYIMHLVMKMEFSFAFTLPWKDITIAVAAVFVTVSVSMIYSGAKIKKENIIDTLKQEII